MFLSTFLPFPMISVTTMADEGYRLSVSSGIRCSVRLLVVPLDSLFRTSFTSRKAH